MANRPTESAAANTNARLAKASTNSAVRPRTLAVDIGGTGIKAMTLDLQGKPLADRSRILTPKSATPSAVIRVIKKLARKQGEFERASVGFPGVVKRGVVYTAANLGKGWNDFDLRKALERKLERPVRVANDADVQGLGAIAGHGIELVITLGTGFGSAIFVDGRRLHLELAHSPFRKGKTYEEELGVKALRKKGKRKWNRMLRQAIDDLKQEFIYDRLYIGGGNAKHIKFKLPANIRIISNTDGLLGGIRLWDEAGARAESARAAGADKSTAMKPMRRNLSGNGKRKSAASSKSAATAKSVNHRVVAAENAPAPMEPPA